MITLRLPDGSTKQVAEGTTPRQVAESIGKRLAQAAIAAKVNGTIVDLDRELPAGDGELPFQILTEKDPESLGVARHSCAHVMARAVMRLFPGVQLAFGPALENGFYYDIDSPTPIREEDFPRIEEEMKKIVKEAEPFERFERPTAEARALVADLNQGYKVEHIDDDLKQYPSLSFYRQGEFIDLCRGPHIPHAGRIGAFKLLHKDVAGTVMHWIQVLRVDPDNRFLHGILVRILRVSPQQLKALSVGTFLYAGLFATEGIGLLSGKRWAEYFTIVTTGGLIPLEIFELARHFTVAKLAVLSVNVLIVWYLAARVRSR